MLKRLPLLLFFSLSFVVFNVLFIGFLPFPLNLAVFLWVLGILTFAVYALREEKKSRLDSKDFQKTVDILFSEPRPEVSYKKLTTGEGF